MRAPMMIHAKYRATAAATIVHKSRLWTSPLVCPSSIFQRDIADRPYCPCPRALVWYRGDPINTSFDVRVQSFHG